MVDITKGVAIEKKRIEVEGRAFYVPGCYQQVDPVPELPAGSVPFATQTEQSTCYVLAYPKGEDKAMPYDQAVAIDAIHGFLRDNQGLIEVNSGMLDGMPYVYSIVKSLDMDGEVCLGAQYILAVTPRPDATSASRRPPVPRRRTATHPHCAPRRGTPGTWRPRVAPPLRPRAAGRPPDL